MSMAYCMPNELRAGGLYGHINLALYYFNNKEFPNVYRQAPGTLQDLVDTLEEEWRQITQTDFRDLVES